MTIRERAAEIVRAFVLDYDAALLRGDSTTQSMEMIGLADAIVKLATPDKDHVRDDEGVDRKVLGTLPLTADGCVAGADCEVFHPLSVWTRGLSVRDGEVTVPTKSGPDGFVCRSEIACVSKCYSTREAALAAHPNEKGSAHGE